MNYVIQNISASVNKQLLCNHSNSVSPSHAAANYTFTLKDKNCMLEISAVGYKTKELVPVPASLLQNIILQKTSATMEGVVIVSANFTKGRLRCTTAGQMIVKKQEMKTSFIDTLQSFVRLRKSTINIFPSPVVKGNSLRLSLLVKQAGRYYMQTMDTSGRILLQQPILVFSKEHIEQVETSSKWWRGIYYLRLFDATGKLLGTKSLLFRKRLHLKGQRILFYSFFIRINPQFY